MSGNGGDNAHNNAFSGGNNPNNGSGWNTVYRTLSRRK